MKSFVDMSADVIGRLNESGLRESFEPLKIVDEARVALSAMPEGKMGVVLGSGPNTAEWRSRGWGTLDIDPQYGADLTGDANYLEAQIPEHSLDFLYAECITFDPTATEGVHPARLLNQANRVLKEGGELVIMTANVYNAPGKITLPEKEEFAPQMVRHGFRTVVESHDFHLYAHPDKGKVLEQQAIYYGKKVADGYSDTDRVEAIF